MSKNFWHQQWESNRIGFHKVNANPLLVSYFNHLAIREASYIFLPLCGKTLDISWLLSNGYRVVGAELSELAIKQLFSELDLEPEIIDVGDIRHYTAKDIDIFVGDIFSVTRSMVGSIDAVFDRGGLVALPEDIRLRYTKHVANITDNASQLLIVYEYSQKIMDGPPFSISSEEIGHHYKNSFKTSLLTSEVVTGRLRNVSDIRENVWLLQTKVL